MLLDHLLPDADSSTLADRLREAVPGIAIASVSGMPNELLAEEAKRTDVEAYLLQGERAQRLPRDRTRSARRCARLGGDRLGQLGVQLRPEDRLLVVDRHERGP